MKILKDLYSTAVLMLLIFKENMKILGDLWLSAVLIIFIFELCVMGTAMITTIISNPYPYHAYDEIESETSNYRNDYSVSVYSASDPTTCIRQYKYKVISFDSGTGAVIVDDETE